MATLTGVWAASPVNQDDGNQTQFDTDASQTKHFDLDNMPADFVTMDDTAFTLHIRYRLSATAGNDTFELRCGVKTAPAGSYLAGATSGSLKTAVANVTNTTLAQVDVDLSGANGFVDTAADKATWDGAVLVLHQQHTRTQSPDGNAIQVTQAWITGQYTSSGPAGDGATVGGNPATVTVGGNAGTVTVGP